MSVPTTNEEIKFKVQLNPRDEDDDPNISSCWVSVDDGGRYEPHYVQDQGGVFNLHGTGNEILHPGTWRELLMLVVESTARHRRAEDKEVTVNA